MRKTAAKISASVIAVVMICIMFGTTAFARNYNLSDAEDDVTLYDAGSVPVLQLNTLTDAAVEEEDGWAYFSFTPAESGEYLFHSEYDHWEYLDAAIYNSNWKELKYVSANSVNGNFTLRYALTAGVTYYYGARYAAANVTGTIPVILVKAGFTAYAENAEVTAKPGKKAVMHVIDSGNVSYQWYENCGWYSNEPLEGETGPTLEIDLSGQASYFCYVYDSSGIGEGIHFTASVDNELYVDFDDGYTDDNGVRYVNYGDRLTMKVKVSAIDMDGLTIEWRYSDSSEPFATGCTSYTIDSVTTSRTIYVEVTDKYGNYTWIGYIVIIDNGLGVWFTINGQDTDHVYISPGETVEIKAIVTANNTDGIHITWERLYVSGGMGWSDGIVAEDVDTYVTEPSDMSQTILCTVTDMYGNSTERWLFVDIDNHLKVTPKNAPGCAAEGEMFTLSVNVTADDTTGMQYYWEEVRTFEGGSVMFLPVDDGDTDTVTVGPMGNKPLQYNCIVTDKYGSTVTTEFTINPISSAPGWHQVDGIWYYMGANSKLLTGWQKIGGVWYYLKDSGAMVTGWQKVDGVWYYFKGSGAMVTGWQKIGGVWYYFKSSGAMVTGWQKISGVWYYFKSSGAMAANEWCEGYWLNANGSWTYKPKGSWHQNSKGWWFGDTSGWYAKSTTIKIDNKNYTFNASGYWVK